MSNYDVFSNGEKINLIAIDDAEVEDYKTRTGYTLVLVVPPEIIDGD